MDFDVSVVSMTFTVMMSSKLTAENFTCRSVDKLVGTPEPLST